MVYQWFTTYYQWYTKHYPWYTILFETRGCKPMVYQWLYQWYTNGIPQRTNGMPLVYQNVNMKKIGEHLRCSPIFFVFTDLWYTKTIPSSTKAIPNTTNWWDSTKVSVRLYQTIPMWYTIGTVWYINWYAQKTYEYAQSTACFRRHSRSSLACR